MTPKLLFRQIKENGQSIVSFLPECSGVSSPSGGFSWGVKLRVSSSKKNHKEPGKCFADNFQFLGSFARQAFDLNQGFNWRG